ncbi:MAG: hypothetical protein R6U46_10205 [Marinilabilia sp.]
MEFKKLEIQSKNQGIKGLMQSKHFRVSAISIVIGAVAGFVYFYFTSGQHMDNLVFGDFIGNVLLGGFLGFFLTNSPCARNKC